MWVKAATKNNNAHRLHTMHSWIENFFVQKDYSRLALEGPNPTHVDSIAIFAKAGRGKSETLRRLKKHPLFSFWKFVSGGDKQRQLNNASTEAEMNAAAQAMADNPGSGTDRDTEIYLLTKALENCVIMEARLSAPILTYGGRRPLRIMLDCPLEVAAGRRFDDLAKNRETRTDFVTVYDDLARRDHNDESRLTELYPRCWWNAEEYDAVVSTLKSPEEVVDEIVLLSVGHSSFDYSTRCPIEPQLVNVGK